MRYSREFKGNSLLLALDDYTVVDIETTGMSSINNEIIEIGAARIRNGKVVETFERLAKPFCKISPFITLLTGISNEMVEDAPSIDVVLKNFFDFLGDDVIVGHNVNFDVNFLYDHLLTIHGIFLRNDYIDTLRIARKLFPKPYHNKLSDLVERFGLKNEHAHRALSDVLATNDVYQFMCKNYAF